MIFRMALPTGEYEYVSPDCTDLCGYTPAEFYASPQLIRKLIPTERQDWFETEWAKLLAGNPPPEYIFPIRGKHRTDIWVHQINTLIWADDGTPSALEALVTECPKEEAAPAGPSPEKEQLEQALNAAAIGIWDWETATGKVEWAGEHAALFGIPVEEFGRTIEHVQAFVHPDDRKRGLDMLKTVLETGADFDNTYRVVRPDGRIRWMHSLGKPMYNETGTPHRIIGVTRDVTDRKHAEDRLQRRIDYEAALIGVSKALLTETNPQSAVNKSLTHLLRASGVKRVYIFENFFDPEEGVCMRQTHEACADGVAPEIDNPVLQKVPYYPGFRRWYEHLSKNAAIMGRVRDFPSTEREILESQHIQSILVIPIWMRHYFYGFIGFDETTRERTWNAVDVQLLTVAAEMVGAFIDHRRMETELRESEERFRVLFQASPMAAAVTEIESGRLVDVNRKFCEISRYNRNEVIGKTTMEMGFYGEIDRNEVFVKVLRETGEVDGMEMEIPLKDGSVPTARIYSRIITLSGKPHAVTMFLDVTEHKRLEARLRQSQKLEAVGTLTGGIAHEFNNIMFIILGNVDLALGDTVKSSPCRRHLTTIREAGLRAKDIVERLLRISRKNHLTKRPLDMAEVVGETLANIGPPHAFDIETAVIAPGEQKLFMGDRVQIQQVIFNLYDNATRAVTRGGKVTIEVSTGFSDMPEAFADRVLPPGEYVRLRVSDTGCGISAKHLERVFDPFFTTREVGQGSGLGLSVVLGIVQAHGAGVRIQSEPARGTTVECWFPAAKAAPAERSKEYPISTGGGAGDDSTPGAEPESV